MKAQNILLFSIGTSATDSPIATISSGLIQGVSTTLPNAASAVNKFLGVPYAARPHRFSLPEPPAPWANTFNATGFGPACLQNFGISELGPRPELLQGLFNNPPAPESEDCLSINIFAPAAHSPDADLAVLVFIPGGGWQLGHGRSDLSAFAAYDNIIAVTLNYRTNGTSPFHAARLGIELTNIVFGFPSSPDLPLAERNLGLHDQRLALSWVQANIAAFGGNPSKVTIWGESAGALSVDHHLKAYADDASLPFRAAVMSSGQTSFGLTAVPSTGDEAWTGLSAAVECSNATNGLECMRDVPAETLIGAMLDHRILFVPQVDNLTVLSWPGELWRDGKVARVPILTGTVAEEGRGLVNDQVNMTAFLDAYLPPLLVPKEARDAIVSVYRSDPKLVTDFDVAAAIYTDFLWSCPQSILASTAASNNISTWRYHFNTSLLTFLPDEYGWLGKFHGSDLILLFSDPKTTPFTSQSYAVYEYFRGAIAQFAKNPFAGPGWPAVGSSYAPLDVAILGDMGDVPGVMALANAAILDDQCKLYEKFWPLLETVPGLTLFNPLDPGPDLSPNLLRNLLHARTRINNDQVLLLLPKLPIDPPLLAEPAIRSDPSQAQAPEQLAHAALELGLLVHLAAPPTALPRDCLLEVEEQHEVGPRQAELGLARPVQAQVRVLLGGRVDDARMVVPVADDCRAGRKERLYVFSGPGVRGVLPRL
ncbi:putative secreted metallopeptidase [Colletotrichum spaethianum]|uniref:Secreted metallopeptidase n=1 Tax=Colletotrichum spaethianum TaxID=700344 RepID=A0AA37PHJ3_9PEZI|nr:putative secreted metallopeptidase [Colletotrichum spaethianum]GKT52135.1 putative secreted metallopeptidase [Colletotrichum spaethianum]